MTLQELKNRYKAGDFVWVVFDDDEAEGIYKDGELLLTLDKFHGEGGEVIERLLDVLNLRLHRIHAFDLLERELTMEELSTDRTNHIPMEDEILKVIQSL